MEQIKKSDIIDFAAKKEQKGMTVGKGMDQSEKIEQKPVVQFDRNVEKSIRQFESVVKKSIKDMKNDGVTAKAAQIDRGEYVEFVVRIVKEKK